MGKVEGKKIELAEAIDIAKRWVNQVFASENLTNVGLEEVVHNQREGLWNITIGFSRPWNTVRNAFTAISGEPAAKRSYKVVTISDSSGEVIALRNRDNE